MTLEKTRFTVKSQTGNNLPFQANHGTLMQQLMATRQLLGQGEIIPFCVTYILGAQHSYKLTFVLK